MVINLKIQNRDIVIGLRNADSTRLFILILIDKVNFVIFFSENINSSNRKRKPFFLSKDGGTVLQQDRQG